MQYFAQGAGTQDDLQFLSENHHEHGDRPESSQVTFPLGIVLQQFLERVLNRLPGFARPSTAGFIVQPWRTFLIVALDPKAHRGPTSPEQQGDFGNAMSLKRE